MFQAGAIENRAAQLGFLQVCTYQTLFGIMPSVYFERFYQARNPETCQSLYFKDAVEYILLWIMKCRVYKKPFIKKSCYWEIQIRIQTEIFIMNAKSHFTLLSRNLITGCSAHLRKWYLFTQLSICALTLQLSL